MLILFRFSIFSLVRPRIVASWHVGHRKTLAGRLGLVDQKVCVGRRVPGAVGLFELTVRQVVLSAGPSLSRFFLVASWQERTADESKKLGVGHALPAGATNSWTSKA